MRQKHNNTAQRVDFMVNCCYRERDAAAREMVRLRSEEDIINMEGGVGLYLVSCMFANN